MKLALFILALAAAFPAGAGAQSLSHPAYRSLERWEALGYLGPTGLIRPYSPGELMRLLALVAERGAPADAALARSYIDELGRGRLGGRLSYRGDLRLGEDGAGYAGLGLLGIGARANPAPSLWFSAGADLALVDGTRPMLPAGERPAVDLNDDGSMFFLPPGLSGQAMGALYGLESSVWAGGSSLYGRASYARASAGPFWDDGLYIGPQAPAAPSWGLAAAYGSWRYAAALFQLVPRAPGASFNHEKYLAFHAYSFSPLPGLDLGLVEAAVWAGPFKPLYLVPLSMLFYLQSQSGSGYGDNSLAGAYASWNFANGFLAKAAAYFDDVGVKELLSLELDAKIIGAVQAGLAWAPSGGPLEIASVTYTAVFPYMYAHRPDVKGTQDNYTHHGQPFGADMLPNSDRFEFKARVRPSTRVSLESRLALRRHGNASEGVSDGDGSWFDDGWVGGAPSYQPPFEPGTRPRYFRFLSQAIIETAAQFSLSCSWRPAWLDSRLSLEARYALEYAWNRGLRAGENGNTQYLSLGMALEL